MFRELKSIFSITKQSDPVLKVIHPKKKLLRIMLVDDNSIIRQGLIGLLASEQDMDIVGQASSGESAVNLVYEIQPDVVLMDINMPGMNGIQATRIIHSALPGINIIGLSMFLENVQTAAMRDAGAVNCISKSESSEAVITAVRACS
jgi:DNA-binding NarL/FixJ family response regulator